MSIQRLTGYLFILGTVLFTVYGQLIIKWQVSLAGSPPSDLTGRLWFIVRLLLNPWVISSLSGAFLAFLCWVGAMTRFELSYAYPFTSASFGFVLVLSALFFRETITPAKLIGLVLIIAGIVVASRG
jgi:multidrug transporter EmrE-like cation transporter